MARDLFDQHFRVAQATPRGVVAKLQNIVVLLERAYDKHVGHWQVGLISVSSKVV